jgi:hypothetical protein
VPYDPTIYLGSAVHYRYGRPAYSPELEAVLTRETGLDGNGRLLDVGCGPGVLTVRLAHLFKPAVGLDPDAGAAPAAEPWATSDPARRDQGLSLSSSAPHLFGDRLNDFAGEVRALLASRSPEGTFWDWPGDTEVVMARKPG